jgi:hypothetical protein
MEGDSTYLYFLELLQESIDYLTLSILPRKIDTKESRLYVLDKECPLSSSSIRI